MKRGREKEEGGRERQREGGRERGREGGETEGENEAGTKEEGEGEERPMQILMAIDLAVINILSITSNTTVSKKMLKC